jgi:hypothetical protein
MNQRLTLFLSPIAYNKDISYLCQNVDKLTKDGKEWKAKYEQEKVSFSSRPNAVTDRLAFSCNIGGERKTSR